MSRRHLFTSESVAEGHPDKVADQISDAILDTFLTRDSHAKVACESCHGALAAHAQADNPSTVKPQKPDPRKTCVICHTASISKPKAFPQVDPAEHAPEGPCTACHVQPHSPKIT